MNKQQYGITQLLLVEIASQLRGLDLDGFIEMIDKADTLAPIFDPTLYKRNLEAGRPLDAMREIAAAARKMAIALPLACRNCGCTETRACEGGCSWLAPGLCSNCAPELLQAVGPREFAMDSRD